MHAPSAKEPPVKPAGVTRVRFNKKILVASAVVMALILALLLRLGGQEQKKTGGPPIRTVEVAKVTTEDVPLYLDEIGTTTAFQTVQVQAQVSGQIISREFQDGAEVKKGDLLFRIDPRPFEAALAAAEADLALHRASLQRQTELRAKAVVAGQEYDVAQANAMRAEAAVAAAKVNLDHATIESPIDGRVGLRNVDVGNVVNPSSPPLVAIQTLDPIYTDFTVAEPDLALVRRYLGNSEMKVVTDSEDDNVPPRVGELYFIDHSVQPGAGTVKARAVTPNQDRALWPSQFVRVRLILEVLEGSKLVPSGAVQIGQNGPYVFVVKADSTLELRPVKPGQPHGEMTVVSEGVEAGETVVVTGHLQLAPGVKVITKEMQQEPKGGDAAQIKTFH